MEADELRELLLTEAPREQIGVFTYSLWKINDPAPSEAPLFSRRFLVGLTVICVGFIGAGVWVTDRTSRGDYLPAKVFVLLTIALLYIGPILALIVNRRKTRRTEMDPESPPTGLPSWAIAARVALPQRGGSIGWLWFDGDLLRFKGVGFDFSILRVDIKSRRPFLKVVREATALTLKRPTGISSHPLFITPGTITGDAFYPDRKRWNELLSDISAWEASSPSDNPSLFPPIRACPSTAAPIDWKTCLAAPFFMGLLLGLASLFLPLDQSIDQNRHLRFASGGALFGAMWPFLLWLSRIESWSVRREVENAIRRS